MEFLLPFNDIKLENYFYGIYTLSNKNFMFNIRLTALRYIPSHL